jgi:hypothetical protein
MMVVPDFAVIKARWDSSISSRIVSPAGLGTKDDLAGETSGSCKLQTHPVAEKGPHISTQLSECNRNLVIGPR